MPRVPGDGFEHLPENLPAVPTLVLTTFVLLAAFSQPAYLGTYGSMAECERARQWFIQNYAEYPNREKYLRCFPSGLRL